MDNNKYDYDYEDDRYDDYDQSEADAAVKKSIRGYRVVIVLLAVILAGISALYFNINRQQQRDYELLRVDRDSIQSDLSHLITEYDSLKFTNDTIAAKLVEANEMMEQLKRERRWNYAKIKEYEKEVGTLRSVMRNYLKQIDSLNNLNKKLVAENVTYRKEISTARLRADVAEEKASELENRVRQGAVLRARDITMVALNARDNVVSRIKNAVTLRVDFAISSNELAAPGNRKVYMCIKSPDGYLLTSESMPTFEYQGMNVGYSAVREVDYQNEDVDVSIYYRGSGFTEGQYTIEIYTDGNLIGSGSVSMR
ncbi:MAG: hypothetical protein U0L45_07915 [Alistipes sp.]|jgi:hypothetical protein|nr:hypothetical protein [Alistipes sp.]MBQ6583738.1 hypothetical protein [Alistipes sp.]MBR2115829.1 hypothetical protein [Alistipes sp.]MEE0916411.1 hypothetical protein [Alistipes sp.]